MTSEIVFGSHADEENFRVFEGETEPRIRDVHLASILGFVVLRRIRSNIARNRKYFDSKVRTTVVPTTELGGRPGTEYWLTKRQALLIVAKSETPKATEMLQVIIDVFDKFTRGELVQSSEALVPAHAVNALCTRLSSLEDVMQKLLEGQQKALAAPVAPAVDMHRMRPLDARTIRKQLTNAAFEIAFVQGRHEEKRHIASLRSELDNELRSHLAFFGKGTRFEELPAAKYHDAIRFIVSQKDVRCGAARAARPRPQAELFGGGQ